MTGHPADLLSARLDDELDPATAREVDRHLRDCASCRRELASVDEARRALRTAPPVAAPAGLVGGFVRRRRRADRYGGLVAAAAAAVALAVSVGSTDADVAPSTASGPKPERTARADQADRAEAAGRPSVRQANGSVEPDPSLTDRISQAARDLLDFLG